MLVEYNAEGCYRAIPDTHALADAGPTERHASATPLLRTTGSNTEFETRLKNGITVCGDAKTAQCLEAVLLESPGTWKDQGQARIEPDDWMTIPLVNNWRELYKAGQAKVYPVGPKDRAIIDADFDNLHASGRMSWSNKATLFSFPCFVVWKTNRDGTRKGRTVVNIRTLNQISVPDAYPVPSQEDILVSI